ncbi:LamG domain-containing protein [Candidatus Woesearchaeota archaeon]|nr:LamG domain-containing protein [Candidatus Woesearchaeota archaeon]
MHKRGGWFLVLLVLLAGVVLGVTWTTLLVTDFNGGTYTSTSFRDGAVRTNLTTNITGNYTSPILNTGYLAVQWNWINWTRETCYGYGCELPNFLGVETGYLNTTNMTGNVLLYHFDNVSAEQTKGNETHDFSGMNTNGTWGAPGTRPSLNTTSRFGKSYHFNGSSYVNLGDVLETTINGTYTISAWVYPNSSTGQILAKYNPTAGRRQWSFDINTNKFRNVVYGALSGTPARIYSTDATFAANKWYHVVYVGNIPADTYAIYVNGTEAAGTKASSVVTSFADSIEPVTLGGAASAGSFEGYIDELAIWNRTLSKEEIENIYKRGMSLNLSVRSCDDALCSGETFTDVINDTPSQALSLANNTYFQYRFEFTSLSANITPALYNVTVNYLDVSYLVPEWSTLGMMLILVIVGSGFFIMNRKENF